MTQQSLAVVEEPQVAPPTRDAFIALVERLATNESVDVNKLEKLIEMQERIIAHNAKSAFWAAFPRMQKDLPRIDENGRIKVGDQVRGVYAKEEDIQSAILPVLSRHGFSLSFRTEYPSDSVMEIVGVLAHSDGHTESDRFRCKADNSGQKNDVQALGSARSYGRRYTTLALLNIITGGQDDDGRSSGRPEPPTGYEPWIAILDTTAGDGVRALEDAWGKSDAALKNFAVNHDKDRYQAIKAKARGVKRG